jgi:hypothetical protein
MFPEKFEDAGKAWVATAKGIGELQKKARVPTLIITAMHYGPHGVFGGDTSWPPMPDTPEGKEAELVIYSALLAFLYEKCGQLHRKGRLKFGSVFDEAVETNRKGFRDQHSFGA